MENPSAASFARVKKKPWLPIQPGMAQPPFNEVAFGPPFFPPFSGFDTISIKSNGWSIAPSKNYAISN
jgi:hypothetical protein